MKKYPFKFLDSYAKEDQDIFFGRDEEIEALYRLVFQANLMLVYGASGTGKTSLIRCGLANRFKASQWKDLYIRRGGDINQSLLDTIRKNTPAKQTAAVSTGEEEETEDWFESFLESEEESGNTEVERLQLQTDNPVAHALQALYLATFMPIYLIFDQFEELYTLGNLEEQQQFNRTIAELVTLPLPIKIIIVMREEYLARLYDLEKAVPQLRNKKLRIEPMDLLRVEQVILSATARNPQSNIDLESDKETEIARAIIDKVREGDVYVKLPYLQVFMDRLYEKATGEAVDREAKAHFSLALVNGMGNIGDVLADFIEQQSSRLQRKLSLKYKDLPSDIVWQILSPFATVDGTKVPIRQSELPRIKQGLSLPDNEQTDELIRETVAELENSRILRYRKEEATYEVAHDTLALQIAEKRSEEEKTYLKARRMVTEGYTTFLDTQTYLNREQLTFIHPYEERLEKDMEAEQWTFLQDSEHKVKRSERRRRWVTGIIAAVLLAATGISIWTGMEANRQAWNAEQALIEAEKARYTALEKEEDALGLADRARESAQIAEEQREAADSLAWVALEEKDRANQALANLNTTRLQVVDVLIEQTDELVLALDYEAALAKLNTAAGLVNRYAPLGKAFMEIAFFYGETYQFAQAQESLKKAAALFGRPTLLSQVRQSSDTIAYLKGQRSALAQLDQAHFGELQVKYYPDMVSVAGGTFTMGCLGKLDDNCQDKETSYKVNLSDFEIARTETTVWQYNLYCEATGKDIADTQYESWGTLAGHDPVIRVNWYHAVQYANWINKQYELDAAITESEKYVLDLNKNGYRLPTEAEWEYAARGGINQDTFLYAGSDDLKKVGWYDDNSSRTQAVKGKDPNSLGIYDMSGNVYEWCWDRFRYGEYPKQNEVNQDPKGSESGSYRVGRGGSWFNRATIARVANRYNFGPDYRYYSIGFRLARAGR